MSTLILNRNDVSGLLDMSDVIAAIERAFIDLAQGKSKMPAKTYLPLEKGDFRAMPCYLPKHAGLKWVNVHPENPTLGLPTVMATLIYCDPDTGYPLAFMDATEITAYRTGATAAIASKYLARKTSNVLGIVGAGKQAQTQLLAHSLIFDLKLVKVSDCSNDAIVKFMKTFPDYPIQACSLEESVNSDIVCTLTPVCEPIIKRGWVKPGTHINAVGADAPGKQELDTEILKDAVIVVDELEQAQGCGEINVTVRKGFIRMEDVYATLGDIISGVKEGRTDDEAITVFDSTGLAIEDLAVASLVYEKALQVGAGLVLDMVEL